MSQVSLPASETRALPPGPEKVGRKRKAKRSDGPLTVAVGFVETPLRKEAVATARGFAERNFNAFRSSYYMVAPFGTGFLWEAQECGRGRAYLPGLLKAFKNGARSAWIRVPGERVISVTLRDDRPSISHQHAEWARTYMSRPEEEIAATSRRMSDVVWKGGSVLVGGLVAMITGGMFYAGTLGMTGALSPPAAEPTRIKADDLPHRQWPQLAGIPLTRYVQALVFKDGRWQPPVLRQVERHRNTPTPLEVMKGDQASVVVPSLVETAGGPRPAASAPSPTSPVPNTPPSGQDVTPPPSVGAPTAPAVAVPSPAPVAAVPARPAGVVVPARPPVGPLRSSGPPQAAPPPNAVAAPPAPPPNAGATVPPPGSMAPIPLVNGGALPRPQGGGVSRPSNPLAIPSPPGAIPQQGALVPPARMGG